MDVVCTGPRGWLLEERIDQVNGRSEGDVAIAELSERRCIHALARK